MTVLFHAFVGVVLLVTRLLELAGIGMGLGLGRWWRCTTHRSYRRDSSIYSLWSFHSIEIQCSAVQCSAVQCSAVQYSAVQCSAVQCGAVQCSAVHCSEVQCRQVQVQVRFIVLR